MIFLIKIYLINTKVVALTLPNNLKGLNDFHPLRIKFDYTQLENYENKIFVKNLKKTLNQISAIFAQFINIQNNKLIKTSLFPNEFCDSNIKEFNKKLKKKGFNKDLLIYPILTDIKDTKISAKVCAIDKTNKRPIIARLTIYNKIQFSKKNISKYSVQIIHKIIHILGFNELTFKKSKILKKKKLSFNLLRNIYEKGNNNWKSIIMKLPNSHYQSIKWDIMSRRINRMPIFSSLTLVALQKINWYQINLSLCGCSLNGDCEYLRYPINLSLFKNINGDIAFNCYFNENINSKCVINDSSLVPKLLPKKINVDQYPSFFEGNHHLNKFLIWNSTIPKVLNPPQIIYLLSPKKNGKCKNPQRTIFLRYPEELNLTNPELENYKLEQYTIKNPNMTVYHSYLRDVDIPPFYKLMKVNNIPFNTNYFLSNFLSSFFNVQKLPEVLSSLGKYQIYSNIPNSSYYLGNKAALFRNYRKLKNKFPKDFEFHPESFLLSEDREILRERFKDYIQTKDDLWVSKPPAGTLGIGIKLMKNGEDFLRHHFINRYISNPHLLHGRKYHIRMYVVVSGILPLKIYVFDEGQVMIASDKYYYNLDQIENPTSMLTNGHVNFNQPGYNTNITLDTEEGNEWTIKTLSKHIEKEGGNWTKVWEEIKDLSIKTILLNYGEIQKIMIEEYPNLRKNNIIHRYGFDIMIDSNFKPWLLEVNTKPAMELYNIINVYNKLRIEADRVNLVGMIPFDHYSQEPLDKEMIYKDKVDEAVQLSICEFERPHGGLERIFPVKKSLNYYKQFIEYHDDYNRALWDLIEKDEI